MGVGKKKQNPKGSMPAFASSPAVSQPSRNLKKADLAGVIFGCKDSTIDECLSRQLFGLPAAHFSYVKNIDQGLPLFLFNYSKRALHGIFEAASSGQMNINPYGWTADGSERTSYPAQVQIRVRKNCRPLLENQFEPIIKENYYYRNHFWFELDHAQVSKLISLFSSQVVALVPTVYVPRSTEKFQIINHRSLELKIKEDKEIDTSEVITPCKSNGHLSVTDNSSRLDGVGGVTEVPEKDERERIYEKLRRFSENCEPTASHVQEPANANQMHSKSDASPKKEMAQNQNVKHNALLPSDFPSIVTQLMQEVEELKTFRQEDTQRIDQLEEKLMKSESEVQQLRNRCMMLESLISHSEVHTCGKVEWSSELNLDLEDIILLAGGYDGKNWLSSLDSYFPSKDIIKSLKPMSSVRSYSSAAKLNGDLYIIGGGNGTTWYDTVESYNHASDEWTSLPCLNEKKGSLAAATLHDKVFAIGGGNGVDCFSDVEMFDLDVGRWISARSMLQKRFALAAVELNGALYAVGGFDGKDYLRSAERFDPREHSWSRLESMNSQRGCHSVVVLNEKLYAIGGFDGSKMVASVEVFDPRQGRWTFEAPMNHSRGYSAAVVLRDSLYVIGGVEDDEKIVEKVERYEEGHGWQVTDLKAVGKRCFATAIVL